MDGREKGMLWIVWEVFFRLIFKGELTAQGVVLIFE